MIDIASVSAALGSLKAASDIVGGLLKLKAGSEVESKVIELQGIIFTAQQNALTAQADQFALVQTVRELEEEVAQSKRWDVEKQKYELKQLYVGFTAYVLKSPERTTATPHAICTNCYENSFKSILQSNGARGIHMHAWMCPACNSMVLCQRRNMEEMIANLDNQSPN